MKLAKKDFIEMDFTGMVKDTGEVFDSNIEREIKKAKLNTQAKPFIFALGEDMFLKGVDEFLIGNEIGEYKIELSPEKAFGKRESKLVQMIPIKVFAQQKINPVPGAVFNFDGRMAKVLTVSGGRVMVDFNNPLAGKEVIYNVKVKRKVEERDEKIKALNQFLFRQEFKFSVKDKRITIVAPKQFKQFIEMFKDKYKELFNLDIEVKVVEEKAEDKGASKDEKTVNKQVG